MKYIHLIIILVIGFVSYAQDTTEREIGEFSTVKVFDLIQLKMIASDENKVTISGKNKEDVEIINKNGILKIRMNLEESYDGNNTVVVLHYTTIDVIDANEGAVVNVKNTIEQYDIDLRVQEGASITVELKTTYATLRAVTGGEINVSGTSKNQDITIYTGGKFIGKDFITENTEVNINAAGEAYIHATAFVDVRIKAGGNVYIYGDPKQVDENTLLGGRIKRM